VCQSAPNNVQEAPEAPVLEDHGTAEVPKPTPQVGGMDGAQEPAAAESVETPAMSQEAAVQAMDVDRGAVSTDSSVGAPVVGVGENVEGAPGCNIFSNPLFSARRPL